MGKRETIRALTVGDFARLGTASVLLLCCWGGVVVSFARLRAALLWAADKAGVPGSPSPSRIVWAVHVVDQRLPGERKCLVRSLTAEVLLHLYGFSPTHRIGVDRTTEGDIQAHSWLVWNDDVLIGQLPDLDSFEELPPLGQR